MPVKNSHDRYQWRGIHAILASCATLIPTLLSVGIPIRGGIDLGIGVEFITGEIYGPVLQSAYHLENMVAKYPRIVVGKNLNKFIQSNILTSKAECKEGISGENYDKHVHWIGTHTDGVQIIDYLGKSAQLMTGGFMVNVNKKAYKYVSKEYKRLKQIGDTKHALRYKDLEKYFKSRSVEGI